MTDSMDRRRFFRPSRLLRAVSQLQQDMERSIDAIERFASQPVVTFRRPAMACMFEIQFPISLTDRQTPTAAFDLIDDLEDQLTVYRDTSEVSRLNQRAFQEPVVVEPRLFELLTRCQDLHKETDGVFDITAGPLVRAWGFYRREGRLPEIQELDDALAAVGMQDVLLDAQERTVRFGRPGMELNFGSIGKGYALDRVTEFLTGRSFSPALLSAGHSSMRAVGKPPWDDAWQVDLLDPRKGDVPFASVRLSDQAFSTSGSSSQFFEVGGKRFGHILDPRTGRPAEGMLQTSVVAPDAALAEALSTAFFIHGVDWARRYCENHPRIGALLVSENSESSGLRIATLGSIDARILPVVI
ncbi:MAG: FAD:protein FMN transferase [Planctomycetota bacterium]